MRCFTLALLLAAWAVGQVGRLPGWTLVVTIMLCVCWVLWVVVRRLPTSTAAARLMADIPSTDERLVLQWSSVTVTAASVLAGIATGAMLGLGVLGLELQRQLPDAWVGKDLSISGKIAGIPLHEPRRSVFFMKIETVHSQDNTRFEGRTVRLSGYGKQPQVRAGERWRFTVRLKAPHSRANPGSADYAGWLFQSRVHALGSVRPVPAVRLSAAPWLCLDCLRQSLADAISTVSQQNAPTTGLIAALTLGVGHDVDPDTRALLRDSGTAHLLAISGLHIGLVAGWGVLLGHLLWRWRKPRAHALSRTAAGLLTGGLLALAYAALAGFSLPTMRALIMLVCFALASATLRRLAPFSALQFAALLVVCADPLVLQGVGFWLSFGTVAVLIYLTAGRASAQCSPLGSAFRAFSLHLRLGLVMLPLSAWFFSAGSLIAPLANLIAVPVVGGLVVPAALLSVVIAPVHLPTATLLVGGVEWLLQSVLWMLESLLSSPLPGAAAQPLALPSWWWFIPALVGTLLLLAPRGLGLRCVALPLLLPAVLFNVSGRTIDGVEVHVLDVGQGLAVLVFTPTHTLLYDTGDWRAPGISQIDSVVMPFLTHHGRHRIDTIIISHPDSDHAAGSDDLARQFPDARWYASQPELLPVANAQHCEAGDTRVIDDVGLTFLHPASTDAGSDNDRSCVLLVYHGDSRVLLTGDIEKAGERRLSQRADPLPVTVMTAPHHGSKSSSTPALLDTFTPEHVVFSAGYRNRFGFPHPNVRLRYTVRGTVQHITARDGAVSFRFDRHGLVAPPARWRQEQQRVWDRTNWHRIRE